MTTPTEDAWDDERYDDVCRFVVRVGVAANGYGSAGGRLEEFFTQLVERFGYTGSLITGPHQMIFAFQRNDDEWPRVHIENVDGTTLELSKLARVGDVVEAVAQETMTLREARRELSAIRRLPPPWGRFAQGLGYALVGAGFAAVLSGGLWDIGLSALFGSMVFVMVLLSSDRRSRRAQWLPLLSSFFVTVLALIIRLRVPDVNVVLVVLSAVAMLLPGYTISLGVIELVEHRVNSGLANLVSGLVYLSKQVLGVWAGIELGRLVLPPPPTAPPVHVDPTWLWAAVPALVMGLCIGFQTNRRDFAWAVLGCLIAYLGAVAGGAMANQYVGAFLGTTLVVIFTNLWSRWSGRPTSIVFVPSVVMLVGGSLGFRGLTTIAQGQTSTGTEQFLQMFVVAATIAGGLLVGNTLVRPRSSL